MICSMTGFGRSEFSYRDHRYRIELRTLNNRFLDARVKLPWLNADLEALTIQYLKDKIHRGRVELTVVEEQANRNGMSLKLDQTTAREMSALLNELASILGSDLLTAAQLLPPLKELLVGENASPATNEVWPELERGLEGALSSLIEMRKNEGQALLNDLKRHLENVQTSVVKMKSLSTEEPALLRDRLQARLDRLGLAASGCDPARLAQEVALFADRCDISEELARLESHIDQTRDALATPEAVGRKIEFLLQEFHRELNTISSKTISTDISHLSIEAKSSVEKMREQIQNVE
jgi:uncharacterized protein (TIGR00255 family)